jgi:hypothetical protein
MDVPNAAEHMGVLMAAEHMSLLHRCRAHGRAECCRAHLTCRRDVKHIGAASCLNVQGSQARLVQMNGNERALEHMVCSSWLRKNLSASELELG